MKIEDHYIITSRVYIHTADNDTILRVKQDIKDRVNFTQQMESQAS